MDLSTVFQLGLLLILAALAGYAIPALIQMRRTAKAMEDMVNDVRPRLVAATANLDSVLGRTDRVMEGLESGAIGVANTLASVKSFVGNLKLPLKGIKRGPASMAALANFVSGALQAWSAFSAERGSRARRGADGGTKSESGDFSGGTGNVR
jgi:hypothetical protein